MRLSNLLASAVILSLQTPTEAGESALSAVTAIPQEDRSKVVRIVSPEENHHPEVWYVDVFSPESQSGVREYAIWRHEIVAAREVSQFCPEAIAEDVFDVRAVGVDSPLVERIAMNYARANEREIAVLRISLGRPIPEARPMWTAECFGASGAMVGLLTLAAENGTLLTYQGFPREPARTDPPPIAEGPRPMSRAHSHGTRTQRIASVPRPKSPPPRIAATERHPAPTPAPARPWWSLRRP